MASLIDTTKPASGNAYTADVRSNFTTAASEISALQDATQGPATTGVMTLGTPPNAITLSVGQGVPGGATPGFDQIGSQYTDTNGSPGSAVYLSNGDGTWVTMG
jgi:hypothetical protein